MFLLNTQNVRLPDAAKAAQSAATQYVVIDRKDGLQATKTVYATRKAASRAVDRLDNIHGGYRYYVAAK